MAVRSLNKVMILGNLTRDPDLRYTAKGAPVCTFGVATNREWVPAGEEEIQEATEFHNVVAWSKLAELCSQLLFKGRKVYIEGRLQTRSWEDQEDGKRRYRTEIVAESMIALGAPRGYKGSVEVGEEEAPSGSEGIKREEKAGVEEVVTEKEVDKGKAKTASVKTEKSKVKEKKEGSQEDVEDEVMPF